MFYSFLLVVRSFLLTRVDHRSSNVDPPAGMANPDASSIRQHVVVSTTVQSQRKQMTRRFSHNFFLSSTISHNYTTFHFYSPEGLFCRRDRVTQPPFFSFLFLRSVSLSSIFSFFGAFHISLGTLFWFNSSYQLISALSIVHCRLLHLPIPPFCTTLDVRSLLTYIYCKYVYHETQYSIQLSSKQPTFIPCHFQSSSSLHLTCYSGDNDKFLFVPSHQ